MAQPDLSTEQRRGIMSDAFGIGIATGAYAISFGAVSVASGLDVWQTQVLSLVMFTGASQFALIGVLGAGGGIITAVLTAWLLGARNSVYAVSMAPRLRVRGLRRLVAAELTIDESTAMALAHDDPPAASRYAFWATGLSVYVLWNLGTLAGSLGAAAIGDPATYGLDAAIPAAFLALLWPRLVDRQMRLVAVVAAVAALLLTPVLRPGLPVLLGACVALSAALLLERRR